MTNNQITITNQNLMTKLLNWSLGHLVITWLLVLEAWSLQPKGVL